MGLTDFRPVLRVRINGIALQGPAFQAIRSVRVTDAAGFVSDTAELTFANVSPLARFIMPRPGAEVEIEMGYPARFRHMGVYIADEVEESAPPRAITVIGRAKAQGETESGFAPIHQQKTRTWKEGLTIEDIAATMAADNRLKPGVTDAAAPIIPGHIDQIDESDLSVLTRIALAHDLIAKPAGGVLFIGRKAEGIKASGQPTPTITLRQADVTRWSMRRSLSEATGTVIATYRDLDAGQDIEVRIGDKEPVRRLRQRFRTEAEARAAADAEARRAGRAKETLEIEMPGNPGIVAGGKVIPIGFSSAASGEWMIETATHEVSEAGYRSMVQAQRPQ